MPENKPSLLLALLLVALFTLQSGCVSLYKPEVQQGNVISAEMLETLKIGMTKRQVVFLLGTPLIADPFHLERWDYFYSLSKNGGKPQQHHLVVHFQGDEVVALDGSLVPQDSKTPDDAGQS